MRVLALLLLVTPLGALAQSVDSVGQLVGRVTDASSGEELPGASVLLAGTTLGAASNIDGDFVIANVPPGVYRVQISYAGYKPQSFNDVQVLSGYNTRLDAALDPSEVGYIVLCCMQRPLMPRDPFAARYIYPSPVVFDSYCSGADITLGDLALAP